MQGLGCKIVSMDSNKVQKAKNTADRHISKAANHPALIYTARAGFVVSGLLNMMIGWIALKIALGSGGGEVSNSGALQQIASTPGGKILLWVMTIGLAALGLWRLTEIFLANELKYRLKGLGLGVVFLAIAVTTFKFASGGSSSDTQKTTSVTAKVLEMPGGVALISLAGVVLLIVGGYSIYKGASKRFKKYLEAGAESGNVGTAIITAGVIGYIARGLAFLVLGVLVIWAAVSHDPQKASGMDGALRTIGDQPFGVVLLGLTALGFVLYGLYSIARAKYTNEIE